MNLYFSIDVDTFEHDVFNLSGKFAVIFQFSSYFHASKNKTEMSVTS